MSSATENTEEGTWVEWVTARRPLGVDLHSKAHLTTDHIETVCGFKVPRPRATPADKSTPRCHRCLSKTETG